MLRIPAIIILICGVFSITCAQDTAHKAKPVKPAAVTKTYKYHSSKYYVPKTDTTGGKRALQRAAPLRHDSTARLAPLTDKSLNGQYQYLLAQVYHYQQPAVSALWKSVSDTLNVNHRKLNAAQSKVTAQGKTIDSLKADITGKEQTLAASNANINGMTVLGITLSKTTYNLIVWGLV